MKQWLDKLKQLLDGGGDKGGKSSGKPRLTIFRMMILAAIGLALLLGGRLFSDGAPAEEDSRQVFSGRDAKDLSDIKSESDSTTLSSIEQQETYMNQNLKSILEQIQGVTDVSVMVTLSSTEKKIYQNNVSKQDNRTVEEDQKGGTREMNERQEDSQVVMVEKEGNKEPVVIGEEQPSVRGVIVVAAGAEQPVVQVRIMEAVATVLDIPTYKVKVLQKNE